MTEAILPRDALFEDGDAAPDLPVCDHYCGTELRMRKALALQAELGPVFDITLDCEDGAPIGAEAEHAQLCVELVLSADTPSAGSASGYTRSITRRSPPMWTP